MTRGDTNGMTRTTSIVSWLDHLMGLMPPTGVVLVGAGAGMGDWVQYLNERNLANVTLIEGDEEQFHRLRRNVLPREGWRLLDDVIAQESGPVLYYRASNRAESGLLDPEGLRGIWSNLTATAGALKTARPLADIQKETKNPANWVIVDCLPALRILQGNNDPLQFAEVVVARVVHDDEALENDALASLKSVTTSMQERGWRLLVSEEGRNPAIGHALFVRDTRALERNLTERFKEAQRDLAATRTQLGREAEAREQAERALRGKDIENEKLLVELTEAGAACTALQQQFQAISHANETLDGALRAAEDARRVAEEALIERESRIRALEIELAGRQAESSVLGAVVESNAQLKTSLDTAVFAVVERLRESFDARLMSLEKSVHERLSDTADGLKVGIEACATRLTSIDEHAADSQSQFRRLDEHLSGISAFGSAAKDWERQSAAQATASQEAVKGVETRLRGEINKGLANAVKQVEAFMSIQAYWQTGENIPQFHGWPISPDLGLALIEMVRDRRYDLIIEFGSGTSTALLGRLMSQDHSGSPSRKTKRNLRRVVSFEHDSGYWATTKTLVDSCRLSEQIDLRHTPLVEISCLDRSQLYYDCETALREVSRAIGRKKARILVLVDGPPAKTCSHARLPALPQVLQHVAGHEIDFVLDDFNRSDEREIADIWRTYLQERGLVYSERKLECEKGVFVLSVNGEAGL